MLEPPRIVTAESVEAGLLRQLIESNERIATATESVRNNLITIMVLMFLWTAYGLLLGSQ